MSVIKAAVVSKAVMEDWPAWKDIRSLCGGNDRRNINDENLCSEKEILW